MTQPTDADKIDAIERWIEYGEAMVRARDPDFIRDTRQMAALFGDCITVKYLREEYPTADVAAIERIIDKANGIKILIAKIDAGDGDVPKLEPLSPAVMIPTVRAWTAALKCGGKVPDELREVILWLPGSHEELESFCIKNYPDTTPEQTAELSRLVAEFRSLTT